MKASKGFLGKGFKKVSGFPEVFRFEKPGDSIQGKLLEKKDFEAKFKGRTIKNSVYRIQTKEGIKSIFGSAILNNILPDYIGKEIVLIYQGKNKNNLKIFEIYVR